MVQNVIEELSVIYQIADELNVSMTELAIRYILAHEEIHSHVAGARELAHIKANIDAANRGPLPAAYVKQIDDVQNIGQCPTTEEMRDLAKQLKAQK